MMLQFHWVNVELIDNEKEKNVFFKVITGMGGYKSNVKKGMLQWDGFDVKCNGVVDIEFFKKKVLGQSFIGRVAIELDGYPKGRILARLFKLRREGEVVGDMFVSLECVGFGTQYEDEEVHEGFSCNNCFCAPIYGTRFKKLMSDEYDICGDCFDEIAGDDVYIPIPRTIKLANTYPIVDNSLQKMLRNAFEKFSERPFLGTREILETGYLGEYRWSTYEDVEKKIDSVAMQLHQLLKNDELKFVGICSKNREEWIISDFACVFRGATIVPLQFTLEQETLDIVLETAHCSVIITSEECLPKFIKNAENNPYLKYILVMDSIDFSLYIYENLKENYGIAVLPLDLHNSNRYKGSFEDIIPGDEGLFTLIYSSGSTGVPKGAMMRYQSWYSTFRKQIGAYSFVPSLLVWVSYSPLAHRMERHSLWTNTFRGGQIGFYSGDMKKLFEEIQMIRPTIFVGAPRIWNKIYNSFQEELNELQNCATIEQHDQIQFDLYRTFSKILGGRTTNLYTGSAPTSEEVIKFINRCFGIGVSDGYGSTEVGGITRDGKIVAKEVKLLDIPDLGYSTSDIPNPRGEILVKTDDMIAGYYGDPEKTEEAFLDGWFRTGDVGEMDSVTGELKIIGRIKNFFKLAQGEFVAPEKIENILIESSFIDCIFVYGDSFKSYLVAVIIPLWDSIPEYSEDRKLSLDSLELKKKIKLDMMKIGLLHGLPSYEIPRGILLDLDPFTQENGFLTSSIKQSRPNLTKYYQEQIDLLYDQIDAEPDDELIIQDLLEEMGNTTGENDEIIQIGDSLTAIRLLNTIKEKYDIDISIKSLYDGITVSQLATFITTDLLNENDSLQMIKQDIEFYKTLRLDRLDYTYITTNIPENILITGCTGFVGVHLITPLLERYPNCHIYCLVRGSSSINSNIRFIEILKTYHLSHETDNITVLNGDLSHDIFGWNDQYYNYLSKEIDLVIHSGAEVNWLKPYSQLRKINVHGTCEILKFCLRGRVKKLIHISSIGISTYQEDSIQDSSVLEKMSGYMQTKWACEKIVFGALESIELLKGAIIRLGMVTGHSKHGICNTKDFVSRYLNGIKIIGGYIDSEKILDMTPVDEVTETIISIIQNNKHKVAFNIYNPNSLSYSDIGKVASDLYSLNPIDYDEFRAILLSQPDNPLYSLQHYFPETGFRFGMRSYSITNTQNNSSYTPPSHQSMLSLVQTYFNYLNT